MLSLIELLLSWVVGLQFILFGFNGFFPFLRLPEPPKPLLDYMNGLFKAKYLMNSIKLLEIIAGLLVLASRTRILGLLLLAPIVYNVAGVHIELNLRKSGVVILQTVLPYLALCALEGPRFVAVSREVLQLT